ncbi:MAG TPA: glycosyltransferase [Patescibacteria group bacterium]
MNRTLCFLVPAYKRVELTILCLESIYKYEPGSIVIFFDDGSGDNSYEIVVKKFSHQRRFYAYRVKKNIGTAGGLNFLLEKYLSLENAGEIFIVMDNDAQLKGKISEALFKYFENPKIGVVGKTGFFIVPEKKGFTLLSLHNPFDMPTEVDTIATYFSAFRKETLQYGLADKKFESYIYGGGDFDLCLNIKLHGYTVIYDPRFPVKHLKRGSSSLFGNDVINKQIDETNIELDKKWRKFYPQILEIEKNRERVKQYLQKRLVKNYNILHVLQVLKHKYF